MVRISGNDGAFLVIEPLRYAFDPPARPTERGDDHRATYDDLSANSMRVRLVASDGRRRRATDGGMFIAWELHALIRWLGVLVDGVPHLARRWSMLDGDIEMEAVEIGGRVHLRVTLGIWPDDDLEDVWPSLSDEGYYHLEFALRPDDLRRVADQLATEMTPFPIRFAGTSGELGERWRHLQEDPPEYAVRLSMDTVTSADGTEIAIWRTGSGPPLVLVNGGAGDSTGWWREIPALAGHFSVVAMDRRGRSGGRSGPYKPDHRLERDIEDLLAVVESQGEPVSVMADGYGALLALEATRQSDPIRRLALLDPVLGLAESQRGLAERLEADFGPMPSLTVELRLLDRYRFDPARYRALRTPTLIVSTNERLPGRERWPEDLAATLPIATLLAATDTRPVRRRRDRCMDEVTNFLLADA